MNDGKYVNKSRSAHAAGAALCLAILAIAATAGGKTDLERKADELAALRSDLDKLEGDIRAERARGQSALRALESRGSSLSMQLDAERVRAVAAKKKAKDLGAALEKRKGQSQELVPLFEQTATSLSEVVQAGLPFHIDERLAAIEDLRTKVRAGRMDPETGCSRLWQLIEDELRLTGETARSKLSVALDGPDAPRRLVDIVRIGMVTMFVRHEPGRFSWLVHREAGWRAEPVEDVRHIRHLEALFDAVSKQVVQGDYALPLPPVSGGPQ